MKRTKHDRNGWHVADIVAALKKQGLTLVDLSLRLGLTRSSASRALRIPHRRVNAAIADILGVSVHEVWPNWFDRKGNLILGSAGRAAVDISVSTKIDRARRDISKLTDTESSHGSLRKAS